MKEELGIIDVPTTLQPALEDDQLLSIANMAEKRIEAVKKIKGLVLRVTNIHDWIDQQGKPYLWASGAEKVARLFGISWKINDPEEEFIEGGHYSFTYKGTFALGGITIEAIGSRSSKDGFFKKYGDKNESGKRDVLPPSEIDRGDVKKAAFTNCLANGITRLLGIRNLTWEELGEAGITRDKVTTVDYGSSKTERTGTISEAQRKRWYAIAKKTGWNQDEMKEYLATIGIESSKEIPVDKYEDACTWASTRPRQPGDDDGEGEPIS